MLYRYHIDIHRLKDLSYLSLICSYCWISWLCIFLHHHPIDRYYNLSVPSTSYKKYNATQNIMNFNLVSKHPPIYCLGCKFEDDFKAKDLHNFIELLNKYASYTNLSLLSSPLQSYLLNTFYTRAPPFSNH